MPGLRTFITDAAFKKGKVYAIATVHQLLQLRSIDINAKRPTAFDDVGHHLEAVDRAKYDIRHDYLLLGN